LLSIKLETIWRFGEVTLMEIVSLGRALELKFWDHVKQDIPHYYFFAFDWKYNRDDTEICWL